MTEPTNPLFEDEKEFLERKKLEYERALRGEVEEIKEQTIHVGKVALVGAGVVGGIWLLAKAFGGSKRKSKKHKKHKSHFDEYAGAGFESYGDYDENEQDPDELTTSYQDPEYTYEHANGFASQGLDDDGFYSEGRSDNQDDYASDTDVDAEADDNGLSAYPDFPAHSTSTHGYELSDDDVYHSANEPGHDDSQAAHSYASTNSYQARPYDDSRRLPESNSFAETDTDDSHDTNTNETSTTATVKPTEPKRSVIGPALLAFAKSETGRVVVAQAAAVALALATKAVQGILPKYGEETDKNADLAASTASSGISPAAWPATSAAQDVSAAAHHDDKPLPREPLA